MFQDVKLYLKLYILFLTREIHVTIMFRFWKKNKLNFSSCKMRKKYPTS